MCLLIIAKDKFPSREILDLGAEQNRDGAGIAYIMDGKVHWKKALKVDDLMEFRDFKPPFLIHFRLASIGGPDPLLCHPFPIKQTADAVLKGSADKVMAHNGHWSHWDKPLLNALTPDNPLPEGPWSDTRAMAFLTNTYGLQFLGLLNEKIAVLNADGKIQRFGSGWCEEDGLQLSYNPKYRTTYGGHFGSQMYGQSSYGYDEYDDYNQYWETSLREGSSNQRGINRSTTYPRGASFTYINGRRQEIHSPRETGAWAWDQQAGKWGPKNRSVTIIEDKEVIDVPVIATEQDAVQYLIAQGYGDIYD